MSHLLTYRVCKFHDCWYNRKRLRDQKKTNKDQKTNKDDRSENPPETAEREDQKKTTGNTYE